jgi:hypothetical protein
LQICISFLPAHKCKSGDVFIRSLSCACFLTQYFVWLDQKRKKPFAKIVQKMTSCIVIFPHEIDLIIWEYTHFWTEAVINWFTRQRWIWRGPGRPKQKKVHWEPSFKSNVIGENSAFEMLCDHEDGSGSQRFIRVAFCDYAKWLLEKKPVASRAAVFTPEAMEMMRSHLLQEARVI